MMKLSSRMKEFSNNEDEVAEVFRIDTNIFNFETPMCKAFKEFNYLLQIDPDLLTKDIEGFEDYDVTRMIGSRNGTGSSMVKLKDEAVRNKAIMEGFIKEDDDESRYEHMRRWNKNANYDDAYETNHGDNKSKELCEVHELSVAI
ncbi:hypothetical protein Tco_0109300 [Tanacetum coccineum]